MEITISGVSEFTNPDSSIKPKSDDIVTHEIRNVAYILNCLDEDDSCVTNFRRLEKFNAGNNKPRSLLVKFNNPWVVRKILARTYRLKRHNEENNTNIFVNRSLSKEEQQKRKDCLTKRWKLISEENYDKTEFKIKSEVILQR